MEHKHEQEYGLKHYMAIVHKRIWLVIVIFVLSVTGAAIVSFKMTPIYLATALLRIEKTKPNIVAIQDVYEIESRANEYYETQHRILKSRKICKQVFDRFSLGKLEKYMDRSDPVASFIEDVMVTPVHDTYLVELSFENENAEMAAKVANAIVDEYMASVRLEKKKVSDEAESKISERIPILREKLTGSEKALREFEVEHSALSFDKRRGIVYQTLSSINAQLTKINHEIAAARAKYTSVKEAKTPDEILALPAVMDSPAIRAYKREKLLLEAQRAALARKYRPGSEPVMTVESKIEVIDKKIHEEASGLAGSIHTRLEEKNRESQEITVLLQKQEDLAKSIDAKMSRYNSLSKEVEGNRKLYEEFVQRQKELQSSSQFDPGTVQIVDRALVPAVPARPRKTQNLLLAALLSLLGGVALTFVFEHLDDSIKSYEDIEKYIKLPLLGVVPSVKAPKGDIAEKDLLAHRKPKSNISEAYRNIRTSLLYTSPNQESKAYVVSSAGPQEGKTTTAINLAIALAHGGKKVLLVDSDLRKPRIHKTFKISADKGLTNCLVGQDSVKDVAYQTEIENLSLMPSGPIPPNPAELLDSPRMKELMAEMKESYDTVIFDSPPLIAVTDAAVLAAQSNGTIQVIWAGNTSRKVVELGRERIENIGAKVIGVILNNMRVSRGGYYYYYYPRYYKYYSTQEESSQD